jgi:amidase
MPTSIQIVAPLWSDALTFRAGAVVEAAVGVTPGGIGVTPEPQPVASS